MPARGHGAASGACRPTAAAAHLLQGLCMWTMSSTHVAREWRPRGEADECARAIDVDGAPREREPASPTRACGTATCPCSAGASRASAGCAARCRTTRPTRVRPHVATEEPRDSPRVRGASVERTAAARAAPEPLMRTRARPLPRGARRASLPREEQMSALRRRPPGRQR